MQKSFSPLDIILRQPRKGKAKKKKRWKILTTRDHNFGTRKLDQNKILNINHHLKSSNKIKAPIWKRPTKFKEKRRKKNQEYKLSKRTLKILKRMQWELHSGLPTSANYAPSETGVRRSKTKTKTTHQQKKNKKNTSDQVRRGICSPFLNTPSGLRAAKGAISQMIIPP
jgi:hypothetical protein